MNPEDDPLKGESANALAEKRAKLIDLIMCKRRADFRGRGVEGAEFDLDAVEADVLLLPELAVEDLITRFEGLQNVIW